MQVNRIQYNNTPNFKAKMLKNEAAEAFTRSVAKYFSIHGFESEKSMRDMEKLNRAIEKLRSINGDAPVEMFVTRQGEFMPTHCHGYLGLRNPQNNEKVCNSEPFSYDDPQNNIIDGFVILVNKMASSKFFWFASNLSKISNEILDKLTK